MDKETIRNVALEKYDDSEFRVPNAYCFIEGAEWLLSRPLADRLTDNEKEKIKTIYFRSVYSVADVQSNFTEKCLIDAIFGTDLFNKK